MATKSTTKKQARAQKSAIKKLRDLGIIKADLRRAPTPATKRALKKYADVIAGRAAVVQPKKPGTFKKLFRVTNGRVIVPRRKGEKVSVTKSGEIVSTRKIGKGKRQRTVRATYKHTPTPDRKKPKYKPRVVYALPLMRHGGVEWRRWKSYDQMVQDIQSGSLKGYKNFADYVVEEYLMPGQPTIPEEESEAEEDRNARLDAIMEKRLANKRMHREAFQ